VKQFNPAKARLSHGQKMTVKTLFLLACDGFGINVGVVAFAGIQWTSELLLAPG
jgi:hypothetical protein